MVTQEFMSMKTLHDIVPHLTPKPIACGTYAANSNIHFFVSEFVEMTDDVPDPSFMASLADLHRRGLSPNDKYGFPIPTFQRAMPQYTQWTDSWEEFFANSIKRVFEFEERTHGKDDELKELEKAILEKVVPRLLRPLETGGRTIQPRLVHGDIWDGNVSTRAEDDSPIIFDASCMYAHNEGNLTANFLPMALTRQRNLRLCDQLDIRWASLTSKPISGTFLFLLQKQIKMIGMPCTACKLPKLLPPQPGCRTWVHINIVDGR
jgi:protein-ribulosamine 3-kinase